MWLLAGKSFAQQESAVIAFWNVENLYDTVNDPLTNDDEFTPAGKFGWTTDRYGKKLGRLAEILAELGTADTKRTPAVIGLCEVENAAVLADLVKTSPIKKAGYRYVHRDSPDQRGIDVCMLYDPAQFRPDSVILIAVHLPNGHPTRDVMAVRGDLSGESVLFVINHWPSRRGGEKATRQLRITAAIAVRRLIDSIHRTEPATGVIAMGDFNDDPTGYSVRLLGGRKDTSVSGKILLKNRMDDLFRSGQGTLAWNDSWNLFDQILTSRNFSDDKGWTVGEAVVCSEPRLRSVSGRFAGYPFRTFAAGVYQGGYSDHFPVYVVLKRK